MLDHYKVFYFENIYLQIQSKPAKDETIGAIHVTH